MIYPPAAVPPVATQLVGPERDAAYARVFAAVPRFAGHANKTDRVPPVIRLTPRQVRRTPGQDRRTAT
jgi:hypothetical protein